MVDHVKLNTHLSYTQFYYQSAPKTLSSICKVTRLLISDLETQASGTNRRTKEIKSKIKGPEFWKPRFKKGSGTLGKYYTDCPSPEHMACLRCRCKPEKQPREETQTFNQDHQVCQKFLLERQNYSLTNCLVKLQKDLMLAFSDRTIFCEKIHSQSKTRDTIFFAKG